MEQSIAEVKGRLHLWYFAIDQCRHLLELSSKANNAKNDKIPCEIYHSRDHDLIHYSAIEMAIIYFCQIINNGNGDSSKVADNNKEFRQLHWRYLVSIAIDESDIERFNSLIEELRTARDQMLGHADGKAFEVKHDGILTMSKQYSQSWKDIDLIFWKSSLKS